MSGRTRVLGLVAGLSLSSMAMGQNALGNGRGLSRGQVTNPNLNPSLDPRGPQQLWGGAGAQSGASSGRLLDNSLYTGSRFNDVGVSSDPMREFAFRRSIVTGNAANGLSFRGDVGYADPRAFREDLGSNDLFSFRRDSLYSGLIGQGIRGTEALQYQMALTTGSTPPPNLVGAIVVPRSFTPAPVPLAQSGRIDTSERLERPDPTRADTDTSESGSLLGTLRSSAAYSTGMSLQPVLVNKLNTPEDAPDIAVTASPLRGVRLSSVPDESEDWRPDNRMDTSVPDTAIEGGGRIETAHDVVMKQLEEAAASAAADDGASERAPVQSWQERLDELRNRVNQGAPTPTPGDEGEGTDDGAETPGEGDLPKDLENLQRLGTFDDETIELMRRSREPVRRLVSPSNAARRDAFREHMDAGQRLLTRERFFDAEERFTRALALRPGDLTAQIGRIHAQLGAGMFLSSAMNLRLLMLQNPELLAMRFDETLLPGPERQKRIIKSLRKKLGIGEDADDVSKGDPQLRREAGLLLAYLGRQTGDRSAIIDGFAAMRAVNDLYADDESQATERRLLELLERVWLTPESDG